MARNYSDRESYGPEFDDRLIKLVRANPAIYDVSHPHYRRNPVRVAIWERISAELGASSRFLQTKWKNIRYNYLQEIKSIETGHPNANVRKRRFTEDLSFLQNTAQTYNVKKAQMYKYPSCNSSDNDSNSYMYPDPEPTKPDIPEYEIIEIEHSEDECSDQEDFETVSQNHNHHDSIDNKVVPELMVTLIKPNEPLPTVTIEQKTANSGPEKSTANSPCRSYNSSPLLTPLIVMGNGSDDQRDQQESSQEHESSIIGNGKSTTNGEITIEPIIKTPRRTMPVKEIMSNAAKRKSMPVAMPSLTPINDPIELYCLSLVDSLRNMPRSERERVKFEFASILKDAKYKDQT